MTGLRPSKRNNVLHMLKEDIQSVGNEGDRLFAGP